MTWWTDLYDDALADVLLEHDDVDATIRFLVDTLAIRPGDRVFDQCCGIGRLAVPLAAWGAEVIGVEQAPRYVERARARGSSPRRVAGEAPPKDSAVRSTATFVVGDAFDYVPPPCAAAFNWWTSFGYVEDDAGNTRMLRRAFDALVPGGRFALDFLNVPGILARFRSHEITRRDDVVMLRESRLDLARGVIHKTWTFVFPDGRRVARPSSVRLYTPDRLAQLFADAGFADLRVLGGVDGQPIALDSPRCIVVGTKPR
jgi:SAM-dependent methyltransferase